MEGTTFPLRFSFAAEPKSLSEADPPRRARARGDARPPAFGAQQAGAVLRSGSGAAPLASSWTDDGRRSPRGRPAGPRRGPRRPRAPSTTGSRHRRR